MRANLTRLLGPGILLSLVLPLVMACGTGGRLVAPEEVAPAPAAPAAPEPDAFRDFSGDRVDAGVEFEVDGVGRAVRGVEVVIRVEQVKTSTWYPPSGGEAVEGTAYLIVEKGQQSERLRLKDGQEGTVLGARVAVRKADVPYDEGRMDYYPKAWITVTAAP
ncbi:MAG: hypothetical protein EP329_22355 [Deltaproteobacteria bacterium]|nr:MAG: hypothetical protein EP329_22355 [Deltaproteobacteria bacterium]